jgi:4-hydroxybenzoate polyprenyltransferase
MSSRDWALTVFVACVIAVIALAFGNLALAVFLLLGVLALAWAIFDPWLKRHLLAGGPNPSLTNGRMRT